MYDDQVKISRPILIALVILVSASLFVGLRRCSRRTPETLDPEYGIRQDVKGHIEQRFADAGERRAVIQRAKRFQDILSAGDRLFTTPKLQAKQRALELLDGELRANACLRFVLGRDRAREVIQEMEKLSYNTYERAKLNIRFNGLLSGTAFRPYEPRQELCE